MHPSVVEGFARAHDAGLWQCLLSILHIDPAQCEATVRDAAGMPLSLEGLGLRSAIRSRVPAFWASWSDCLPMIQARNPDVAAALIIELEGFPMTPILGKAAPTARELVGVQGHHHGEHWQQEKGEPGTVKRGWQHEAASRVERRHRDEELFPGMNDVSLAQAQEWRCPKPNVSPHAFRFEGLPRDCCANCNCPHPKPRTTAGVATTLTYLAITAQLVQGLGC